MLLLLVIMSIRLQETSKPEKAMRFLKQWLFSNIENVLYFAAAIRIFLLHMTANHHPYTRRKLISLSYMEVGGQGLAS